MIFSGPGGTPELLEQHGAGAALPAEDPAALARAIEDLADDPARRDAMGRAGRGLTKQFGWHVIVERWLNELGYLQASA